jgi:hypothetical protein
MTHIEKPFFGYNNESDARAVWGDRLDKGVITTVDYEKVIDPTKFIQETTTASYTRIELPEAVVAY